MRISLIVAMDRKQLIGRGNALPWRIPEDLRRFRSLTMGKPMVMGRLTHESIGRVLPGRRNLVVSTNPDYTAAGCETYPNLDAAFAACPGDAEVMVIGGATLYAAAMPVADRMYVTWIDDEFRGDTYFPPFAPGSWELSERVPGKDIESPWRYEFRVYDRADR